METEEIQQALSSSEFFKGFDSEQTKAIAGICTVKNFKGGEFLFRQGDFGEHLYVIVEGQIHLERSVDFGQRKGTAVIETLGKGRILGCWSTLLNAPHVLMSSANCQRPTRVLSVKGSELHQMMTRNTDLGFDILQRLCFLLRDRIQAAYGAMEKF
jgi:CRP-like cAMP-binding protein